MKSLGSQNFLQHLCQKYFSLKTSRTRVELSHFEVRTTPLFNKNFRRSY